MPLVTQKAALLTAAALSALTLDQTAFRAPPPALPSLKGYQDYRILSGLREVNGAVAHGLLFKATAAGGVARLDIGPLAPRLEERVRERIVLEVEAAIEERVRPALAPGEAAYFFMQLHDRDLWMYVRDDPGSAAARALTAFAKAHPNLYWLHWNPTLIDSAQGHVGTNVIPIPDFEVMGWGAMGELPGCASRKPGVVWRGTTTGRYRPGGRYADTDRYRAVAAFQDVAGADVKFSKRAQGVTEADVPDAMLGRGYNRTEFGQYRVQLDVDGNSNAWSGLRWKLSHGAAVVKVRSDGYVQWYYPLLVHGTHLLVADVAGAAAAAVAAADPATCDALGAAAHAFADAHLRPQHARAALFDALENFRSYAAPRDWRIQGTQ
eukprot:TRINITY_DN2166_c2_g2_i2.p2 TRINITY_DN2166_c2_g2~~TRINITY_DN2166_c2_g2_i2.p2  ORF type:complete len:379 (+),score=134.49 TRINITY_DN2166_c2_g2_i2:70-1206(+)